MPTMRVEQYSANMEETTTWRRNMRYCRMLYSRRPLVKHVFLPAAVMYKQNYTVDELQMMSLI